MEFKTGYNVKPESINLLGEVTYTDGTNSITPNQKECEAYGYTYDEATGTCKAYMFNTNLNANVDNANNVIRGKNNTTFTGTNNTYVIGENNIARGLSRNNIIVGSNNEIDNSINNTTVLGTKGISTADNSIVLGGNAGSDLLGERQTIQLMYGTQTTAGGTVDSYLNNVTNSFFVIPDNSIMFFHAYVLAVRVGGSAGEGAVGDYASFVERGVVINRSGTLSIQREKDTIKTSGVVTDWRPVANVSGTNFRITVRGETNTTVEWNSTINFTEIKTGVAL
tara:strand:- start:545 stop:1384 length:840 start_codon:yes stop_codon:yes gene_type:complete